MSKKTKIKQHTPPPQQQSQKLRFERPEDDKIRSYPAPEASHEPEPAKPSPSQPASKNMANFANVMNATFHWWRKRIILHTIIIFTIAFLINSFGGFIVGVIYAIVAFYLNN